MSTTKLAHLTRRSVIRVSGPDAVKLLDGLVTNSLDQLDSQPALHSGLLSPQGKILFDFFITRAGDDLLIDTTAGDAADLIKRLSFYRLRADVTFEDLSEQLIVVAAWHSDLPNVPGGVIAVPDPRNGALGQRLILPRDRLAELPGEHTDEAAYDAHRIRIGIPEAGIDYALGDTFPHEALYDQLHSVDFSKGCFIGQEVVSRMRHRGTARKRVVPVEGQAPLTAAAEVIAGAATIGSLGSVSANRGLALLRLDRANEAKAKGEQIVAGDIAIEIAQPDWLALDITTGKSEDQS